MYGPLIILYLFLGGAAAGALFVISAWSIAVRNTRRFALPGRQGPAFIALRKRIYVAGLCMLAFAMACLLWDLGAPSRALLLFLRPHPTVLTFGAYTLAIQGAIVAVLTAVHVWGVPRIGGRTLTALEAVCCIGAVAVMAYTGVFLYGGGIAFWHTWALVGLFTFSSLSAGTSTVLLIDWITQDQTLLLKAAKPLQKWHLAFLAFETLFLTMFMLAAFANPAAGSSQAMLLDPEMLACAFVGIGGFGILLPSVLEVYSLTRMNSRAIPVADVACLIGCFILRYVVIVCGVH